MGYNSCVPIFKKSFTVRTYLDKLRWIHFIADATGKVLRWHLRMLLFEFDIFNYTCIRQQAANALLGVKTENENGTTFGS